MITLIYTKQIIHLSGPVDGIGFLCLCQASFGVRAKGWSDHTLPPNNLVYYGTTEIYEDVPIYWQHFNNETYGVNQYPLGCFGVIWPCFTPGCFSMLC